MSDKEIEFPVTLVAIGTIVRPHPTKKGQVQNITPGTLFKVDDAETLDRYLDRTTRALPAARIYTEEEAAPPAFAEGDEDASDDGSNDVDTDDTDTDLSVDTDVDGDVDTDVDGDEDFSDFG